MAIRRVRPSKVLVGTQFSRRDFLKLSGTGLAGAALLGTAGCGSVFGGAGGGGGGGAGSSILNLNLTAEIPELDSALTTDTVSFDVLTNVMEGFYRLDLDNEPVPAAAEGVELSNGDLTYTFTLRDGLQWSNGDPVTSHDYKYAWLKVLNPDTAATYAYIISTFVKGADEYNTKTGSAKDVAIETPDDKTLRVTVVSKAPFFLQLTSFAIYFPQQQEFVKKLDKYWDKGSVGVNTVNGRIVKEEDTAINLYEGGELDLTQLTGDRVKQYRDNPDFFRFPLPFTVY